MNTTNTAAAESLRSFALDNGELEFAHLCTAALNGEEWAIERVIRTFESAPTRGQILSAIRATDTTRPDGAVARSFAV